MAIAKSIQAMLDADAEYKRASQFMSAPAASEREMRLRFSAFRREALRAGLT